MRFASRASCWRWKAVLERSPAYVMVALAARGPIRTECGVFCFVLFCLTLNQTAVLEAVYRSRNSGLQGQN